MANFIVHTTLPTFAFAVGCSLGGVIVTGRYFNNIPRDERNAILVHERHHLKHSHALKRILCAMQPWSWNYLGLMALCHDQEYEADLATIEYGLGNALCRFLTRFPSGTDLPVWHPTNEQRLCKLREALRSYVDGQ